MLRVAPPRFVADDSLRADMPRRDRGRLCVDSRRKLPPKSRRGEREERQMQIVTARTAPSIDCIARVHAIAVSARRVFETVRLERAFIAWRRFFFL